MTNDKIKPLAGADMEHQRDTAQAQLAALREAALLARNCLICISATGVEMKPEELEAITLLSSSLALTTPSAEANTSNEQKPVDDISDANLAWLEAKYADWLKELPKPMRPGWVPDRLRDLFNAVRVSATHNEELQKQVLALQIKLEKAKAALNFEFHVSDIGRRLEVLREILADSTPPTTVAVNRGELIKNLVKSAKRYKSNYHGNNKQKYEDKLLDSIDRLILNDGKIQSLRARSQYGDAK